MVVQEIQLHFLQSHLQVVVQVFHIVMEQTEMEVLEQEIVEQVILHPLVLHKVVMVEQEEVFQDMEEVVAVEQLLLV